MNKFQYPPDIYINSKLRQKLFKSVENSEERVMDNPIYLHRDAQGGLQNFLRTMSSFEAFTETQLDLVANSATTQKFNAGDIIFEQGSPGELFFIVHSGQVEVLIQDDPALLQSKNYGSRVTIVTEGLCFGERALMTREVRAATIRCLTKTSCLVVTRSIYEDVLAEPTVLIHPNVTEDSTLAGDDELRSLFKHIQKIQDISLRAGGLNFGSSSTCNSSMKNSRNSEAGIGSKSNTSIVKRNSAAPPIQRILYELTTAFTPELSIDEVITRMVLQVKQALNADRVGFFLLSEGSRTMVLKVSERAKGISLPVRGLAGEVILNNEVVSTDDAYKDPRFDASMDRRTGYRTRQLLAVPVQHPISGDAVGALQVNNRANGDTNAFTAEETKILEVAAEQLSELVVGRESLMRMPSSRAAGHVGEGSGAGVLILDSSAASTKFGLRLDVVEIPSKVVSVAKGEPVIIEVSLYMGMQLLCPPVTSMIKSDRARAVDKLDVNILKCGDKLQFDIATKDVPRVARIMFKVLIPNLSRSSIKVEEEEVLGEVHHHKKKEKSDVFGWAASPVFDFKGNVMWRLDLGMFSGNLDVPIRTTLDNQGESACGTVRAVLLPEVYVDTLNNSTVKFMRHMLEPNSRPVQPSTATLDEDVQANLERIFLLSFNPCGSLTMTAEDKEFVWSLRYSLFNRPELLPCFVMSVRWDKADDVAEFYSILDLWQRPSPKHALQLLDRRFMDAKVRAYAVHCLEPLDDENLALFMLQLCQQLKFEAYIDSALARFLVRRAIISPRIIGHIFFWMLKSEMWQADLTRRFATLLQVYVEHAGTHRVELGQQNYVMKVLEKVAESVISEKHSKASRLDVLRKELSRIVLPIEFQLPLNPNHKVSGIVVEKCRVMESKKKPLWLTFKNADYGKVGKGKQEKHIVIMLKVGDDLRQDELILQLLGVMDAVWKQYDLDMRMKVYDCRATGFERGMLQVVTESTTLAHMVLEATDGARQNRRASGAFMRKMVSAFKAFGNYDVIKDWLKAGIVEKTQDPEAQAAAYEVCVENFMYSAAAYCVASYVLGIGDRHNDNLMMHEQGHYFHIDFGHILGHFKYFHGIKRERAPFVFTHSMKALMTDQQFGAFEELCCDAYNILRENSMLLVSLVSLAIPCGLPELEGEKDVQWLYDKLLIGATDDEAANHFKEQLRRSLETVGTRINDAAHMIAHA